MNHVRNAIRFSLTLFWFVVVGLAFTAISNSGNAHALSWATFLFYGAVTVVVLYVGIHITKTFWNFK